MTPILKDKPKISINNQPPFGFPAKMNWKVLVDDLDSISTLNINEIMKKMSPTNRFGDYERWYLDLYGRTWKDLSSKKKLVAFAMCAPPIRYHIINKYVIENETNPYEMFSRLPEGRYLLDYAKAKGFADLKGFIEYNESHPQDSSDFVDDPNIKIMSTLAIYQLLKTGLSPFGVMSKVVRLLPLIIVDMKQADCCDLAARAFFSVAMTASSRLLFDLMDLQFPELFKKHFSNLIMEPVQLGTNKKITFVNQFSEGKYNQDEIEFIFNRLALKVDLLMLAERLNHFSDLEESYDSFYTIEDKFSEVEPYFGKTLTNFHNSIKSGKLFEIKHEQNILNNCISALSGDLDWLNINKSTLNTAIKKAELLSNDPYQHDLQALVECIRPLARSICEVSDTKKKSLNDESAIKKQIESVFTSKPIEQHQEYLLPLYEQLKVVQECSKDEIDSYAKVITDLLKKVVNFQLKKSSTNKLDIQDKQPQPATNNHKDAKIQELMAQVKQLELENKQITKEKNTLEHKKNELTTAMAYEREELNRIKGKKLTDSIPDDIRQLLVKSVSSPQECEIEELLKAVSVMFSDSVCVLDSAYKSARESAFQNKATIWELLLTLCSKYLPLINEGCADAEARKVFPVKSFAAKESQRTESNKITATQRQGIYNGQSYQFNKHLRVGCSLKSELTVRIHFEVINNVLVIQHCGTHMPLLR